MEAKSLQPARATTEIRLKTAAQAAPGPVAENRIHQPGKQRGVNHVAHELGALRHRARGDGARSPGEHHLEEPEGPQRAVGRERSC